MKTAAWIAVVVFPIRLAATSAEDMTRPTPPADVGYRGRVVEKAPPRQEGEVADENQVLLDRLAGVVVAADAASALRLQAETRSGVVVEGFPADEERAIRAVVVGFVGKPVTLGELNRMLDGLGEVAKDAGFLLRRISFPAQEITSGVVAVRMGTAVVGDVKLAGRPVFGGSFIRKSFRTRSGEPLDEAKVLDDLEWLNRNPLRRTTISQSPGEGDDALDLTLRVRAAKPWRVYGGVDNQLSETLGDERLYLGFQQGDVFGLDHRLTGQVTTALQEGALLGGSLSYEMPLVGRQIFGISGGYTESETKQIGRLDQSGEFTRAALSHRVQLPRWRGIAQEWKSGMEFRNNDYLFPSGASQTVRFFQLETGWEGRRADAYGSTRFGGQLLYSPGQGVLGSEDADFIALGADGAESLILRMNLERTQRIGEAGALVLRMRGQWADSDLLSSDQLTAGGMAGVRGFDEVVGYASNGLFGGLEWQSPLWKSRAVGDWMGVVFVDGAVLDREIRIDPGELLSAGFGCRVRWKEQLSGRLDVGFPLECPDSVDSDPMLHFSIGMNW
jgi:hemolysin activation/secretion protein